jgi:hypothetical protein
MTLQTLPPNGWYGTWCAILSTMAGDPIKRISAARLARDQVEEELQAAILDALKKHEATEEIAKASGYSRQQIRRKAEKAGLPPAKRGPKPL